MVNKQPPRMFTGANRPPSRAPKPQKAVEEPKDLLEQSKVSPDTPLFHGTTHYFKEGELLVPKDSINARFRNAPLRSLYGVNVPPKVRTTDYVYSTSDLGTAKKYARQAAEGENQRYAPVFQVAPTSDVHSLHKLLSSQDPKNPKFNQELLESHRNSYITDQPMVPGGVVAWVEHPGGKNIPKEFDAMVSAASAMVGGPKPTYKPRFSHLAKQFANIPVVYSKRPNDVTQP